MATTGRWRLQLVYTKAKKTLKLITKNLTLKKTVLWFLLRAPHGGMGNRGADTGGEGVKGVEVGGPLRFAEVVNCTAMW